MTGSLQKRGMVSAGACFLCELAAVGIGAGTNSLYTAPICGELGISRTAYAFSITLMYLVNMAVYCLFPVLLRKVPLRGIFALGFLSETAAFLLYASARSLGVLYLAAALLGAGLVFLGAVPITAVVSGWFPTRQGTVLGIVLAGSGIGGAVLIPVVGSFMNASGWRAAFLLSAGIIALVAVPCLCLLREAKPQKAGPTEKRPSPLRLPGMPPTLCYAFLTGFSIQPIYLSIAAHLAEKQIDALQAAQVLSVICLVSLGAKVLLGGLSDRKGPVWVLFLSHAGFLCAAVSLVFLTKLLFLPELFFGIGCTPLTLVLPLLCARLFREHAGTALSLCMAAQTAGIASGILLAGGLYDAFGSYDLAFLLLGGINLAALFLMLHTYRKNTGSVPANLTK